MREEKQGQREKKNNKQKTNFFWGLPLSLSFVCTEGHVCPFNTRLYRFVISAGVSFTSHPFRALMGILKENPLCLPQKNPQAVSDSTYSKDVIHFFLYKQHFSRLGIVEGVITENIQTNSYGAIHCTYKKEGWMKTQNDLHWYCLELRMGHSLTGNAIVSRLDCVSAVLIKNIFCFAKIRALNMVTGCLEVHLT